MLKSLWATKRPTPALWRQIPPRISMDSSGIGPSSSSSPSPSSLVDGPPPPPPLKKAIVVLMGWWGAQPRQLDKYVQLYQDILPSAFIIAGTANPKAIFWYDTVELRQFAREGLEAAARTLEQEHLQQQKKTASPSSNPSTEDLPILVHCFSNGGAFVWHQMIQVLENHDKEGDQQQEEDGSRRLLLDHTSVGISSVRSNIRCQIYDSSPAYPALDTGVAALEGSGMIRSRFLLIVVKCFFVMVNGFQAIWSQFQNRPHRIFQFWKDLVEDKSNNIPQGFIYSPIDRMVNVDHLQTFIQERQNRGITVSILTFPDSPHVQHYRYHPEAYKNFVRDFVHRNLIP